MEYIDFIDFEKIILCTATILEVHDFERARNPAYKVKLDCGEYGVKWSSAQITNYTPQELI